MFFSRDDREPKQKFYDMLYDLLVITTFIKFLWDARDDIPSPLYLVAICSVPFLLGIAQRLGSMSKYVRIVLGIAAIFLSLAHLTPENQVFYLVLVIAAAVVYTAAIKHIFLAIILDLILVGIAIMVLMKAK